jgi:hypothetical protein
MSTNPLLDEINGLSPGAKQALLRAHTSALGSAAPVIPSQGAAPGAPTGPPPALIQPPSAAPSVPAMGMMPDTGIAPHPSVIAPRGTSAGDQAEVARLRATGAGVDQIKNPFLRGLGKVADTIGSIALPGLAAKIPGTTMHHNLLGQAAEKQVGVDIGNEQKQAQTANLNADVPLKAAQTAKTTAETNAMPEEEAEKQRLEDAQITNLLHPQAKTAFEAWRQQNLEAPVADFFKAQQSARPDPKLNDFESFYKDYITDNNLPDSAHNRLLARKEFAAAGQAPQRPAQITVVTPGGQVETAHAGDTLAPGTTTVGGFNQEQVAGQKQTAADAKTQADAKKDYQLMQTLANHPSPTNDLAMVMHYIGATKPDSLGKLRLNQNEIALVLGTRSSFGDLEAMAEKIRSGQKLTPQQRNDMLSTMRILSGSGEAGKGDFSVKQAMGLPFNKGKSEQQVRDDLKSHGYNPVE